MDPAECVCLTGNLLVSAVAICLEDSMESFQKIRSEAAVPARMVLIDTNLPVHLILSVSVHPHERLRSVLPVLLVEHLDWRFIRMNDWQLQQIHMHSLYYRHEPVFCWSDDPVCQGSSRKHEPDALPLLL